MFISSRNMITIKLKQVKFPVAILVLFMSIMLFNTAYAQDTDPYLGIIPAPASLIKSPGTFTFSKLTVIKADLPKDKAIELFKDFLLINRGVNNKVVKYNPRVKGKGVMVIFTAHGSERGVKLPLLVRVRACFMGFKL
jgi:hexosaminidase